MYGGLGTAAQLTLSGTSHYFAPLVAWELPNGVSFTISPGFGLNDNSHRCLLRWGVTYEISGLRPQGQEPIPMTRSRLLTLACAHRNIARLCCSRVRRERGNEPPTTAAFCS